MLVSLSILTYSVEMVLEQDKIDALEEQVEMLNRKLYEKERQCYRSIRLVEASIALVSRALYNYGVPFYPHR